MGEVTWSQLSAPVNRFIGRESLVGVTEQLIRDHRLVSLTGAGGLGKTRLSLELAARLAPEFANGCAFIALDAVSDPGDVPWRAATGLDLQDLSTSTAEEKLVRHLADKHLLLVLDNCEHVLVATGELVLTLLARCPRLHILTTSREPLGIAGEHALQIPPMQTPSPTDDLATVAASEAVHLLRERAAQACGPLDLTEENRASIVELCIQLDGMPLALELAAVRLRSLTPQQLLDRLDRHFELLRRGGPGTLPRHKTLRALMDWSYELCTPRERLLWARMSVFSAGCDLEAAETVAGFGEIDPAEVLDLLDGLVAKSLVTAEPDAVGMRYRQLVTIRDYGRNLAESTGELAELRRRHRDLLLDRAHRMHETWACDRQPAWLAAMRRDHADIIHALEWSLTIPAECDRAAELAALLRYHWVTGRFLSAGRFRLEQVLASPHLHPTERAHALWVAAWVALIQGDHADGERHLAEAEELTAGLGDELLRGHVSHYRGLQHHFQGARAAAEDCFRQAVEIFERLDETAELLTALFQLTFVQSVGPTPAAALATCDRLVALSTETGEQWCRAYGYWARSLALLRQGDLIGAREDLITALEIQEDFLDGICISHLLVVGGCLATAAGDHERSARLHGLGDAVFRTLGTGVASFGPDLADAEEASRRRSEAAIGPEAWAAGSSQPASLDHEEARRGALAEVRAIVLGATDAVGLTPREAQIAELVAQGLSNKQIANRLTISIRTVDGHVERVLAKFKVRSRAQIVARMRA